MRIVFETFIIVGLVMATTHPQWGFMNGLGIFLAATGINGRIKFQ